MLPKQPCNYLVFVFNLCHFLNHCQGSSWSFGLASCSCSQWVAQVTKNRRILRRSVSSLRFDPLPNAVSEQSVGGLLPIAYVLRIKRLLRICILNLLKLRRLHVKEPQRCSSLAFGTYLATLSSWCNDCFHSHMKILHLF